MTGAPRRQRHTAIAPACGYPHLLTVMFADADMCRATWTAWRSAEGNLVSLLRLRGRFGVEGAAIEAFERFGKGRHPSRRLLCLFAYACAELSGVPVL